MKLQNPFSVEKREVFRDAQYCCWECGGNGSKTGGTELHHIRSRVSSSVFNGAVLCKRCHSMVGHSQEEEKKYLIKTFQYIMGKVELGEYTLDEEDNVFLKENILLYKE